MFIDQAQGAPAQLIQHAKYLAEAMAQDGVQPRVPELLATIAASGKMFNILANIAVNADRDPAAALSSLMAQGMDAISSTDLLLKVLLDREDGFDLELLVQW